MEIVISILVISAFAFTNAVVTNYRSSDSKHLEVHRDGVARIYIIRSEKYQMNSVCYTSVEKEKRHALGQIEIDGMA